MVAVQDFLSVGMTIVILCVVVACAAKLFQMATDIRESKDLLRDIARNTAGSISRQASVAQVVSTQAAMTETPMEQGPLPHIAMPPSVPGPSSVPSIETPSAFSPSGTPPTAEELVRMIHAQSFKGEDFPV